jgi:hypothetical protein
MPVQFALLVLLSFPAYKNLWRWCWSTNVDHDSIFWLSSLVIQDNILTLGKGLPYTPQKDAIITIIRIS